MSNDGHTPAIDRISAFLVPVLPDAMSKALYPKATLAAALAPSEIADAISRHTMIEIGEPSEHWYRCPSCGYETEHVSSPGKRDPYDVTLHQASGVREELLGDEAQ